MNVYPKSDGQWYALVTQCGIFREIGPYMTPNEAAINAELIESFDQEQQNRFPSEIDFINQEW